MRVSRRTVRVGALAALGCACALSAAACEKAEPSASEPTALPFGETFTAIEYPSERRELVDPAGLEVDFVDGDSGPVLRWKAGCNNVGARLGSRTEIAIRAIETTDEGCRPNGERSENEAARFFESDPRWSLEDGVLTLSTDKREIELYEERTPEETGGEPPPFAAALLEEAATEARSEITTTSCVSGRRSKDAILDEGIYRFVDLVGSPTAVCTAELADGRLIDTLLIGTNRPHWLRGDTRPPRFEDGPPADAASLLEESAAAEDAQIVDVSCAGRRREVALALGDPVYAATDYVALPAGICTAELADGRLADALLIRGDWFVGQIRPAAPELGDELDCPEDEVRTGIFDATVGAVGLPTPRRALSSYLRFEDSNLEPFDFVHYRKNRFRLRISDGRNLADLRAVKLGSGGYLIGRYEICGGALSR